jgi:hypothetical protein
MNSPIKTVLRLSTALVLCLSILQIHATKKRLYRGHNNNIGTENHDIIKAIQRIWEDLEAHARKRAEIAEVERDIKAMDERIRKLETERFKKNIAVLQELVTKHHVSATRILNGLALSLEVKNDDLGPRVWQMLLEKLKKLLTVDPKAANSLLDNLARSLEADMRFKVAKLELSIESTSFWITVVDAMKNKKIFTIK